jgi:hypothetical protein
MDFAKIKRTRRVEVQIGEDTLHLDYIPRRWDAVLVEKHNALLAEEDEHAPFPERGRERYVTTLERVVEKWDITQDGQPVEVCEAFLRQVEDAYLLAMYGAVRADIEAREEAKNS